MQMNTTITFELESGIREQLAVICDRYNLSLEEAFTLFAEAVVQAGRFPYDMEIPNAVTQAAMAAAERQRGILRRADTGYDPHRRQEIQARRDGAAYS